MTRTRVHENKVWQTQQMQQQKERAEADVQEELERARRLKNDAHARARK